MRLNLRQLILVSGISVALGAAGAGAVARLSDETRKNLDAAMHGEAFAAAKYMLYSEHARANGHKDLAAYFEKAASVERTDHFAKEAKLYGLVGSDEANLREAIKGESYESKMMYPQFAEQAKAAGDSEAVSLFREIAQDEAQHRDRFQSFLSKLSKEKPQ